VVDDAACIEDEVMIAAASTVDTRLESDVVVVGEETANWSDTWLVGGPFTVWMTCRRWWSSCQGWVIESHVHQTVVVVVVTVVITGVTNCSNNTVHFDSLRWPVPAARLFIAGYRHHLHMHGRSLYNHHRHQYYQNLLGTTPAMGLYSNL